MRQTLVNPLPPTAVVTPVAPVGAGNPDPLDLDAAEQLQHNEDARLQLVRARAEKWIGGVGALSAVLATALVIKGPDDATKIILGWRIAAAVALGTAIILLALATYRAYQAAFGSPTPCARSSRSPSPACTTGSRRREKRPPTTPYTTSAPPSKPCSPPSP